MSRAIPFVAITIYAGLTQVPGELIEAARVDGAGPARIFRDMTLPILKPIFVILASLSVIWDFQVFSQIWIIRNYRPESSYYLISIYSFVTSFNQSNYGLGSALEYYHDGFRPAFARWGAEDFESYHRAVARHRTTPGGTLAVKLALLIALPVSGYLMDALINPALELPGGVSLPSPLPRHQTFSVALSYIHKWGGFALLGIAALHIAAALWHGLRPGDRTLRAMLPRSGKRK